MTLAEHIAELDGHRQRCLITQHEWTEAMRRLYQRHTRHCRAYMARGRFDSSHRCS